MGHYDGKKGLQTLVLYVALLCVSFAAFHYENVIYLCEEESIHDLIC